MTTTCDLAIVGATGLVGESLVALLEERGFPLGRLFLLAGPESAGSRVEFRGSYVAVQELAGFDFATAQIAIFATGGQVAAQFAPRAAAAGCIVIDTSPRFRDDPDVPLVIPEVNPEAVAVGLQQRLLAVPASAVTELLVALRPIERAVGLERFDVTVLEPVSGRGREAIDELAGQTAALLNGQPIESQVFPKQIAFNCLPGIAAAADSSYTKQGEPLVRETRRILGDAELPGQFTRVQVPVFFGETLLVHAVTRRPLAASEVQRLLAAAPGLNLMDEEAPTPFESVGQDMIFLGPVRLDPDEPRDLSLWVVADNVRRGVAWGAVRLAELLVKEYL